MQPNCIFPSLPFRAVESRRETSPLRFAGQVDHFEKSALERRVEQFFLDLVGIASPSGQEERVRDYCIRQLKAMGAQYQPGITPAEMKKKTSGAHFTVDKAGNLLVYIPSSLGASGKQIPNLVTSAHLDTVGPALDKIKPIIQDEAGDRVYHAPPGTVLGGDDKGAIAAFLADIEMTLKNPERPRAHRTYIMTVSEEPNLGGAKKTDPNWFNDAHLLLNFDNTGAPWQTFHNQAPAKRELHLKAISESLSQPRHFSIKGAFKHLFARTKTFHISVQGKSAHLSDYQKGESAVLALVHDIQNFVKAMDGRPVEISVFQFQGGEILNAVPQAAEAVIQLKGRRKQLRQAEQILRTTLANRERTSKTQASIQATRKQKLPQNSPANRVLIETLQKAPIGIQENNAVINAGIIRPLAGNSATPDGVVAQYDIRAPRIEIINQWIGRISAQFKAAGEKAPGVKTTVNIPWEAPDYYTSPEHPSVKRAIEVCKDVFGVTPLVRSARGLGDANIFAQEDSTIFEGKVPTLELGAGWHNAHTPGDKQGVGRGEWARRSEIVDIVRLLQALSLNVI
jgi:acetylornithine deacetylase/succinyl-diaminopimelate desuccinylase-like protein